MKILTLMLVITLIVCLASLGLTEEVKRTAKIASFEGKVHVQRQGENTWTLAEQGMVLNEGDIIRTKEASRAVVDLTGIAGEEVTAELQENSLIMLMELLKDEQKQTHKTMLDLAIGKVLIKAKTMRNKDSDFEVKTPTSVTGIRGTSYLVQVEALE